MCGIFGVFNIVQSTRVDETLLRESTDLMSHRGPDDFGFKVDQEAGVGLGHRRLSIIDLASGHQPMSNEDQTVWIVFNGEIYNYRELRESLIAKGYSFRTRSDTEVIIHAYEEFGEDCPKLFNGIFSFAIWDYRNRKMFLARDHFGVKPLYYSLTPRCLVFSSELKSILHYKKDLRTINPHALASYVNLRYSMPPYTLVTGINKLPPGGILSIATDGNRRLFSYLDEEIAIDHSRSEAEWSDMLAQKVEQSVERQLIADVPVGVSLSGGVDSGLILSLMSRIKGSGIHAFTIGFEGQQQKFDESSKAFQNANRFRAVFHYRQVGPDDFRDFMGKFLWHLEEPISNTSAAAYYFIAEMAKGTVKVLLNGQGADELFAGYDRYTALYYIGKYGREIGGLLRLVPPLLVNAGRSRKGRRLRELINYTDDVARIASIASIITEEEREHLFKKDLFDSVERRSIEKEVANLVRSTNSTNLAEKAIVFDMFSSLSENLLLCEDKMAMAASIEARVPFLDTDFAFTSLRVPIHLKINNGENKSIFKAIATRYLPRNSVYQKKIGFNNPVGEWLRRGMGEELLDYVHSSNSVSRDYLDLSYFDKVFLAHKRGKQDLDFLLFSLYSVEKWADIFLRHPV